MPASHTKYTVRVWDLPTRLFHWALASCVLFLAVSGSIGGSAMVWHFRFGYAVLALLVFRLVWGLIGGRWSRFAAFIYGPRSVLDYLRGRGKPEHSVGHTPLGAASVFAILGILIAQVATGLMSDDEISFAGPLTSMVSNATVGMATNYHTNIGKWLLLGLVAMHIVAIGVYLFRSHNLIGPMMDGDKTVAAPVPPSRDDGVSRTWAAVVLAASSALAWWVSTLAAPAF
jgi:cytochrome b